ncbi:P1 family peptidase [Pseudonocardia sp. NPDC049154]|uniref:P1 family peptidase n=1 Tax=Pseudonocardia sp. NPDC049154 TaxID=3155501 RepID=UPI00340058AB
MHAGAHNAITDIPGILVGHAAVTGEDALSGTTVVLCPRGGATAGADVRGAAPGTRETDLLAPGNSVQRVHAVVLSGGSAYGLAAAQGVMDRLEAAGEGFPVPGGVVPIVPAAVLFDLGRGGRFTARPTAETGAAAYDAAAPGPVLQGVVGAGTGATAGGLKGGIGSASVVLDDGTTVAALVAVNATGSPVHGPTGRLLGARHGLPGEFPDTEVAPEAVEELAAVFRRRRTLTPATATSLAVVATDATLDKAGCGRLATVAHDGYARSLDPVHTAMDGDAIFALATGDREAPGPEALYALHAAAADVVARAVVHAVLAATPVSTRGGSWPSYRSVTGVGEPAGGAR